MFLTHKCFTCLKHSDFKIFFLLLIISVLGYYNISFLVHPLKWDFIDQAYPYRYFISECISNNIFPYWLPFQHLGIPVCADPQSGVWYPLTWLISLLGGYNIYIISFEFIFHIFIASIGFYLLGKTLGFKQWLAFVIAVCYMFSGFIVGNSQHLFYVISAAWLPFVVNSYILLIRHKNFVYALSTALFLFLLTTGGYPAFWIILCYHILIIFIAYSVYLIVKKNYNEFKIFLKNNILFVISYSVLALPFFVSILYNSGQIGRFDNISLAQALSFPFSPQCSISFIAPFAVAGNMEFFKTDYSMANAYFGIITLAFLILFFFQKKSKLSIIILITGFINLLIAFGDFLPLREFLYNYIPLLDFLKYPSVFRLFFIAAFIILCGYSMQSFSEKPNKKLFYVIITMIAIFVITIVVSRFYDYLNFKTLAFSNAWIFPNETSILQRLAFQLSIQLIILLAFLLFLKFSKIKLHYLIVIFVVFDLLIATRLNSPCTVYYGEFNCKEIRKFEKNNFIKGFPIPDKPMLQYSDSSGYYQLFWRNLSIFNKRPAFDGYNPFQINSFTLLSDNHSVFFQYIKKNKLFYFADTVINKFDSLTAFNNRKQGLVFIEDKDFNFQVKNLVEKEINIKFFSPTQITINSVNNEEALLVFIQNANKGWEAKINNKATKIFRTNLSLMSVIVPAGNNEITFIYKPLLIIVARYISLIFLIVLLVVVVWEYRGVKFRI